MAPRHSIILLVIDALRADCTPGADPSPHLQSVGLQPPRLPTMTELVSGAFTFTQAIACAPYTTTAHASLFTGLLPPEHGVRSFSLHALHSDVRTLAEILSKAGYATCIHDNGCLIAAGLERGFQTRVEDEAEALAWWDSFKDYPRFLFVHMWDVHKPYAMPAHPSESSTWPAIEQAWEERMRQHNIQLPAYDPEAAGETGARQHVIMMQNAWERTFGVAAGLRTYMTGLEMFDRGRLRRFVNDLKRRRALDDTILVVTADHGEGRHQVQQPSHLSHASTVLDDQIRIPLFVKMPGFAAPRPIPDQVSQADIAPTILAALGLEGERTPPTTPYSGRSLLPLMMGQALPERPAYAEMWIDVKSDSGSTRPTETIPFNRCLRYPQRKYWLAGEPLILTDALLSAPLDIFVTTVVRGLLARREQAGELERWRQFVGEEAVPNVQKRRTIINNYLDSEHFKKLHKYTIYDLQEDPLELLPRDPRLEPDGWAEYGRHLNSMVALDRQARPTEMISMTPSEQEEVEQRLRLLGYIE